MAIALEVVGLHKSYGRVEALRGVSFALAEGQRLALLGPNGAGKTSLVRCLCGSTVPGQGSMRLLGKPLPRTGGREALGLVPQEIALYSDLTAGENLMAFARFHGLRGAELRDRVAWALHWTGLSDQRHDLLGTFSGGMKRRINIACGVLHRPRVLLLDEPTVGVDPQSRQRIYAMLDLLCSEGTAILLTTHHLDEAEQQCDDIVILDHGRVAASGTFEELVRQTVGTARHVRLRLTEPVHAAVEGWEPGSDAGQLLARVEDLALQLPPLLTQVQLAGYVVRDVEVQTPSLHHVFLHLTGHQLRD